MSTRKNTTAPNSRRTRRYEGGVDLKKVATNTLHKTTNLVRTRSQIDDAEYLRYQQNVRGREEIRLEGLRLAQETVNIESKFNADRITEEYTGDTTDKRVKREALSNAKVKDLANNKKSIDKNKLDKDRNAAEYDYFQNTSLKGNANKKMIDEFEERDKLTGESNLQTMIGNTATANALHVAETELKTIMANGKTDEANYNSLHTLEIQALETAKTAAKAARVSITSEIDALNANTPPETPTDEQNIRLAEASTASTDADAALDAALAAIIPGANSAMLDELKTKVNNFKTLKKTAEDKVETAKKVNQKSMDDATAASSAEKTRQENTEKYRKEREAAIKDAQEKAEKTPKSTLVGRANALFGRLPGDDTCIDVPIAVVPASVDCISVNLRRFVSPDDPTKNTRFYADAIQFKDASQANIGEPIAKSGNINDSLFASDPNSMRQAMVAANEVTVAIKTDGPGGKPLAEITEIEIITYESQLNLILNIDPSNNGKYLIPGSIRWYTNQIENTRFNQYKDIIDAYITANSTNSSIEPIKTNLAELVAKRNNILTAADDMVDALKKTRKIESDKTVQPQSELSEKIENAQKDLNTKTYAYDNTVSEYDVVKNKMNDILDKNQEDKAIIADDKITKLYYIKNSKTLDDIINAISNVQDFLKTNILSSEYEYNSKKISLSYMTRIRVYTLKFIYVLIYFLEIVIPDFIAGAGADTLNSNRLFTTTDIKQILNPHSAMPTYIIDTIGKLLDNNSADPSKQLATMMNATKTTKTDITDSRIQWVLYYLQQAISTQLSAETQSIIKQYINNGLGKSSSFIWMPFAEKITKGGKARSRNARRAERRATRRLESAPM